MMIPTPAVLLDPSSCPSHSQQWDRETSTSRLPTGGSALFLERGGLGWGDPKTSRKGVGVGGSQDDCLAVVGSHLDAAPWRVEKVETPRATAGRSDSMPSSEDGRRLGSTQGSRGNEEGHAGTSQDETQHQGLGGDIVVVQDPDGMVYSMAALPDGLSEQINQRKARRVADIRRMAEESFRRSQQRSQERYERFYTLHAWIFIVLLSLDLAYVIMLSSLSFSRDSDSTFGDSGVAKFFVPIYSNRKAIFALLGTVLINVFGAYGSAVRSRGFLTFVMYANIALAVFLLLESFAFEPFIKIVLVLYAFYLRCIMIMLEDNVYNFSWAMLSPSVDSLLRRIGMVDSPPIVTVEVPVRDPVGEVTALPERPHSPEKEDYDCQGGQSTSEQNPDIESQILHVVLEQGATSVPSTPEPTEECTLCQQTENPAEEIGIEKARERAQVQLGIVVDD